MNETEEARMIDRWFPVSAVDVACGTTAGSGKVEKAIFPWFASRPIAQARAAALTALLPFADHLKADIDSAVRHGRPDAIARLNSLVIESYGGRAPIVLDMFSGRGLIPLEAGRAGAKAIGTDLSPVAVLAGRLLTDYPARDWRAEPPLPFPIDVDNDSRLLQNDGVDRLSEDVRAYLSEIGRRSAASLEAYFPRNEANVFPWGYVWAITIPCDECKRRFPLVGSLVLRYPYVKTNDAGQSLHFEVEAADAWSVSVIDGPPLQQPTYSSSLRPDGSKKKGKTARCLFCGHGHALEAVKAKGEGGEYKDALLVVSEIDISGKRWFRLPSMRELEGVSKLPITMDCGWPYAAIPDELIPPGNVHTVMASGYGYRTFGEMMCPRQATTFVLTIAAIREVNCDLLGAGISHDYVRALAGYAAAVLCRKLKYSTRGAGLQWFGEPGGSKNNNLAVKHIFTNESKLNFQFDWFETGPGDGPGSWTSMAASTVQSIKKLLKEKMGEPARMIRSSACALPLRDQSVDVVITDPPYYDMIEYADASDMFYVWLKRLLFDMEPDLFGPSEQANDGLQDKNQEIIVRRVHEPNRVKHDTAFYESMLAKSFEEARRVLKPDGHLVVMFGHSDPDAWRRLLGALQTAGFVVTSAWPSRTESANTGVASIKVTVTIGCRVAAASRPAGMGSEVDREVIVAVGERVWQWENDGLALEDQLMASYGPAMEVYGRYSRVLNPDGSVADLDHYLSLARRTVRDSMRLRVDELPLETFDAITRFSIFWLRAKGRSDVPKGEARFFAQADELRIDDLRERILIESKAGFQIRLDDDKPLRSGSSTFEVVRAMAQAWDVGGMESVAEVIASANLEPNNQHLWAVVGDLSNHLPSSDKVSKALAGIKRSFATIATLAGNQRKVAYQEDLFEKVEI